MQHFEVEYGGRNSYTVMHNRKVGFEATKFAHAALYASIHILRAYDQNERVNVVYRGKISGKDKWKIDSLVEELWPKR